MRYKFQVHRRRLLKRQSAGSSGPVLWTPLQLGAKLVGWWDASNFATITQAGGLVSAWASLAGGITANAAGVQRPTYSGTARNGKPGLTFAAAQVMNMSSVAAFGAGIGPAWMMATGYTTAGVWTMAVYYGTDDVGKCFGVGTQGTGNANTDLRSGGTATDVYVWTGNDACVIGGISPALGLSNRCNGDVGNDNAAAVPNIVLTVGTIGAYLDGVSNCWQGVIQEVIVINGALTASDLNKLAGYSMWKWGIQALLAPGNPYASAAPTL